MAVATMSTTTLGSVRRIAILGPSGSGKSYVATRLVSLTALPLVHLDRLAWQPGWRETNKEELIRIHEELLRRPAWVIDGNYTNVGKAERIMRADLVIVLEARRMICLARLVRRPVMHHGRSRPDMPPGCTERLEFGFLRFCWDWHRRHPAYGDEIARQAGSTPVVILRSRRDVEGFPKRASATGRL
jgi:adenylate kinase family enzyme